MNLGQERERTIKQETDAEMDDNLRPHYGLGPLPKGGVRGKYAERYRAGTNLVLLEPDVARAFPDDGSVNEALRLVMQLTKLTSQGESGSS